MGRVSFNGSLQYVCVCVNLGMLLKVKDIETNFLDYFVQKLLDAVFFASCLLHETHMQMPVGV
jgi:hypothetical protein